MDQQGLITGQCCRYLLGPTEMNSLACAAFHVVKEEQLHKRYLTLYDRRIRFPASEGRPVSLLAQLSSMSAITHQRSQTEDDHLCLS